MAPFYAQMVRVLLIGRLVSSAARVASEPKLYFYAQGNLRDPPFLRKLTSWMDIAKSCNYDGMFYADSDIQTMHVPGATNATFHAALADMQRHADEIGLELAPLIFPFGPSAPIFEQPPWGYRLAEPLAFRAALFEVDGSGQHLKHVDEFGGIRNGDFSSHTGRSFDAWVQDLPGRRTLVASSGCHSAGACLQIDPGPGDGLVMQPLVGIAPYTQLHISFFARTSGFRAVQCNVEVRALLPPLLGQESVRARMGRRLSWWSLDLAPTSPWQKFEYIATSWDDQTALALFVGVEARGNISETQQGTVWFDDIAVSTTALVNLIRREGAPLRIYDSRTGEKLDEGLDTEHISDPLIFKHGRFDSFHASPLVTLPSQGSRLRPGQRVRIDYFAVIPVFGSAVASCLLHEGIFTYMRQSAQAIAQSHKWAGFLLSYDEIRQLRNDAAETSGFASPGDLLAWHVRNATRTARAAAGPAAELYVWDDMFNPFHNAASRGTPQDGYFLANGSLVGSWKGLDPGEVTVLSWGPCDEEAPPLPGEPPCRFRSGLQFFASRGLRQMVGGYYDYSPCVGCPRNASAAAEREFHFAHGIKGIEGFSYTTWGSNNDDGEPHYEHMCDYARTLRRLHAEAVEEGPEWKEALYL